VPRDTEVISGGRDKDYRWVRREAEYGILLGKRVIYFVEEGVNEERVRADLMKKDADGLIPSTARVPEWLEQRLIDSFINFTRANFMVGSADATRNYLDPNVREVIDREAVRAIEKRHRDIVAGFYKQFPESARETLRHVQELVPYPASATKNNLARKLWERYPATYESEEKAKNAIKNVWTAARDRALMVGGEAMPLMKLTNKRLYTGNLREILKRLRPDMSKSELVAWERKVLTSVVPDNNSM
jgi:hypothetical protein